MTGILLFWASKGVDGFRCDMAEMVPTAFWAYATGILKGNERKDQEVLCLSKDNTGNTDKSQKEGIDRFDEENWCNVGNIINHTTSLK